MVTCLILLINNSTKYVTIVKSCFWLFKAATLKTMRATSAPSKEQDYYVHKYATKKQKKTGGNFTPTLRFTPSTREILQIPAYTRKKRHTAGKL